MKLSYSYLDDMLVRMAHHSTAIEGNTLTQYETKSILLDGIIPKVMNERELSKEENARMKIINNAELEVQKNTRKGGMSL